MPGHCGQHEAYSCIFWLIGIHSADSQEDKIVNYILGCVLRSRLLHAQDVNVVPARMIKNLSVHSCLQRERTLKVTILNLKPYVKDAAFHWLC